MAADPVPSGVNTATGEAPGDVGRKASELRPLRLDPPRWDCVYLTPRRPGEASESRSIKVCSATSPGNCDEQRGVPCGSPLSGPAVGSVPRALYGPRGGRCGGGNRTRFPFRFSVGMAIVTRMQEKRAVPVATGIPAAGGTVSSPGARRTDADTISRMPGQSLDPVPAARAQHTVRRADLECMPDDVAVQLR